MLHNGPDCIAGKTVVNLFSDGGILSVFAAHSGAKEVFSVEPSAGIRKAIIKTAKYVFI